MCCCVDVCVFVVLFILLRAVLLCLSLCLCLFRDVCFVPFSLVVLCFFEFGVCVC